MVPEALTPRTGEWAPFSGDGMNVQRTVTSRGGGDTF